MNQKIIDPVDDEARKTAIGQPHTFVSVDRILKIKTDGYNVQVTLGWEIPSGGYSPVATAAMPLPFARELAEALLEADRDAAGSRKPG